MGRFMANAPQRFLTTESFSSMHMEDWINVDITVDRPDTVDGEVESIIDRINDTNSDRDGSMDEEVNV